MKRTIKIIYPALIFAVIFSVSYLFFFYYVGKQKSDIVVTVAVIGTAAIATTEILTAIVFQIFIFTKVKNNKLSFKIIGGKAGVSNQPTSYSLELKDLKATFFSYLSASPIFEHRISSSNTKSEKINGFFKRNIEIEQNVEFPHRGIWKIQNYKVSFSSMLGFFGYELKIAPSGNSEVIIMPPKYDQTLDPQFLTRSASDQITSFSLKREGDYYDFKKYQVGDDSRRIIWKLFAKSGELIVRRQENTTSQSTTINIYLSIKKEDDLTASRAFLLIDEAISSGLGVRLSTDSKEYRNFYIDETGGKEEAYRYCLEKVFEPNQGLGNNLERFCKEANSLGSRQIFLIANHKSASDELRSAIGQAKVSNCEITNI